MRIPVRFKDGEIRIIDEDRHKELMRDGFRPVSGKAEGAIVSAVLKLRNGNEVYRLLKCDRGPVYVRTKSGEFTVSGNCQVLYVRSFEG